MLSCLCPQCEGIWRPPEFGSSAAPTAARNISVGVQEFGLGEAAARLGRPNGGARTCRHAPKIAWWAYQRSIFTSASTLCSSLKVTAFGATGNAGLEYSVWAPVTLMRKFAKRFL